MKIKKEVFAVEMQVIDNTYRRYHDWERREVEYLRLVQKALINARPDLEVYLHEV